jgi:hypothetical protein
LVPVEGVDCGKFTAEDCRVMKAMEIDIDIFVNYNWVDTRWQ